jgi:predicted ester cyclase
MDIKEFAQKYIKAQTEAWLQGKVDGFDELENTDVVYHFQPPNPDRVGLEGHKKFFEGLRKAFTNIQIKWKYLTGEGNLFVVAYVARVMFTGGELPGFAPPTGKEETIYEMFVCRLEKGKIVEVWVASSFLPVQANHS